MSLKILFVGSNPSNTAASTEAFTADTASGRILRSWITGIEGQFCFENIVPQKTENNRPLTKAEMAEGQASLLLRIKEINPDRIVALGKSAASTLVKLNLKFLEMPHPSGLNRKLNDRAYVEEQLVNLRHYCQK
jgi:uracil-DNA glycosylase